MRRYGAAWTTTVIGKNAVIIVAQTCKRKENLTLDINVRGTGGVLAFG
jgi:hypothetical protein